MTSPGESLLERSSYDEFVAAIEACEESAPVVSEHRHPQPSPQEWECGCVTRTYVTDRDFLQGESPFEMRLVRACLTPACEVMPLILARDDER